MLALLLVFALADEVLSLSEIHINSVGEFVDENNHRVIFHGFNSVYKAPPYYNAKDVTEKRLDLFRRWGFNAVRLGVLWHPAMPSGPGEFNTSYLDAIESQVKAFAKMGIYVILDMHQDSLSTLYASYDAVPTWLLKKFPQPNPLMSFPWPLRSATTSDWIGYETYACQKAFQCLYDNVNQAWRHWGDFWEELAKRFKDEVNVLGYELINEPFAGNIYTNPLRALPGYAGKKNLLPAYDYLVNRIRKVDKTKLVFFEGVTWSVFDTGSSDTLFGSGFSRVPGALSDPEEHKRSVYSYHYYCPLIELVDTSKNFSNFMRMLCDEVLMPRMFSAVKNTAGRLQSGRFLTEFGICVPDGNPNSINTVECNAVMTGADAQLQSWTYWDRAFFDDNDDPIINHIKPFARVYPHRTAGYPVTLYFDVNNASAFYAFMTTEETSEATNAGLPIVSLFLPLEMHYAHGYSVETHPRSITFVVSSQNDHVLDFFAPTGGLLQSLLVEINIKGSQKV